MSLQSPFLSLSQLLFCVYARVFSAVWCFDDIAFRLHYRLYYVRFFSGCVLRPSVNILCCVHMHGMKSGYAFVDSKQRA